VVAKKRKTYIHKYGEKQQNKTKYSEQVCHSVVVCITCNVTCTIFSYSIYSAEDNMLIKKFVSVEGI